MAGRLYYVTGISGTGIEAGLLKCIQSPGGGARIRPLKLIKFEDDFLIPGASAYQDLLPVPIEEVGILDVLSLPKPLLKELCGKTFNAALKNANQIRSEQDSDVILTFHACWYHLENREYMSCVDFHRIGQPDASAGSVITLVDDIYDVKSRLSAPRGLFQPDIVSDQAFLDSVVKLTRILEWRGIETLISERIATASTGGKHFVLATKHPMATFEGLLNSNRKMVYLAHPISEIRRMLRAGGERKASAGIIMDDISEIASLLRREVILFEPTTIDELRFEYQGTIDKQPVTVPLLGDRWDMPSRAIEDLIFVAPETISPPFGSFWEENGKEVGESLQTRDLSPDQAEQLKLASPLVRLLYEEIRAQIKARDFTLVEQCDGIAAYRPLLGGHLSGGVKQELVHHSQLVQGNIARATTVIFHPANDETDWRLSMLRSLFDAWATKEQCLKTTDKDLLIASTQASHLQRILGAPNVTQAGNELDAVLAELGGSLSLEEGGALSGEAAGELLTLRRDRARTIRENTSSYIDTLGPEPWFKIFEHALSPTQFVDELLDAVGR